MERGEIFIVLIIYGDQSSFDVLQTGTTSLFFAAQGGFVDIVALLIEHGATVDSCSIVSINFFVFNFFSLLLNNQILFFRMVERHFL